MRRASVLQPSWGEGLTIVSLDGVDERQLGPADRARRGHGWRSLRESQTAEYCLDDARLFDRSDMPPASATRTREDVDREDANHPLKRLDLRRGQVLLIGSVR